MLQNFPKWNWSHHLFHELNGSSGAAKASSGRSADWGRAPKGGPPHLVTHIQEQITQSWQSHFGIYGRKSHKCVSKFLALRFHAWGDHLTLSSSRTGSGIQESQSPSAGTFLSRRNGDVISPSFQSCLVLSLSCEPCVYFPATACCWVCVDTHVQLHTNGRDRERVGGTLLPVLLGFP